MGNRKQLSIRNATAIFGVATIYFYLLLNTLFPFLKENLSLNPAVYWFITGYFIFIPLFFYAVVMARREGNRNFSDVVRALNLSRPNKSEWQYAVIATVLVFVFTAAIYGVSMLLNKYFGVRLLNTSPWFMEGMKPFVGKEKLLLLVWLPMFFFNIAGEEILWRGYIQSRMKGKYSWMVCSLLWAMFHLPFGFDLIIMALPALIMIPYVFHKRNNTVVSIIIHGVYNGPVFIMISLGLIH